MNKKKRMDIRQLVREYVLQKRNCYRRVLLRERALILNSFFFLLRHVANTKNDDSSK